MAVTETPRFGATRWSAGTDPFTRAQMDVTHQRLEERVVGFLTGTLAARPAAAAGNARFVYEVSGDATAANNRRLFWSTGSAWIEFGNAYAVVESRVNTQETTTSTTHANLTTIQSVPFTIPASGKIAVDIAAAAWNSGANLCYVMYDIYRTADGVVLQAPDVQRGLVFSGTLEERAGVRDVSDVLTAGEVVTVRLRFAVNAGTGTFRRRYLAVHAVS